MFNVSLDDLVNPTINDYGVVYLLVEDDKLLYENIRVFVEVDSESETVNHFILDVDNVNNTYRVRIDIKKPGDYKVEITNGIENNFITFKSNIDLPTFPDLVYSNKTLKEAGYRDEITLSYYPDLKSWVSFHSYKPLFLCQTTSNLFSFKESNIYKHNGTRRNYFYGQNFSSYIDIVFKDNEAKIWTQLEFKTLNINIFNQIKMLNTIQYITVYNNHQCSFRIKTNKDNCKRIFDKFNFNEIRNLLCEKSNEDGIRYMKNIFQDYEIIDSYFDENKTDYYRDTIIGDFIVVRLEFEYEDEFRLLDVKANYNDI